MSKLRIAAALAACFIFAVGCSSDLKRAQSLMDGGSYAAAAEIYEKLLKQDPKDTDAINGLRLARLSLVGSRLIEIRRERLGGNPLQALDDLNSLLKLEAQWGLFPGGAVAFTQKEESHLASQALGGEFTAALRERAPLRASWLLLSHAAFVQTLPEPLRAAQQKQLKAAAVQSCASWRQRLAPSRPYLSTLALRFCRYFAEPSSARFDPAAKISAELYTDAVLNVHSEQLTPDLGASLEESVRKAFRLTPWRDAAAQRTAAATAKIAFTFERTREAQTLYHGYSVEIPFMEYENRTETHEVPYLDTEHHFDSATATMQTKQVWKSHAVSETKQVAVTHYRTEQRTFTYQGWRVAQHAKLLIEASAKMPADIEFAFSREEAPSQIVHDADVPGIGLYPTNLALPEKNEWFAKQAEAFAEAYREKLDRAWSDANCIESSTVFRKQGVDEAALRCARLGPVASTRSPFLERWFATNLGVTVAQADQMIGLSGNRP